MKCQSGFRCFWICLLLHFAAGSPLRKGQRPAQSGGSGFGSSGSSFGFDGGFGSTGGASAGVGSGSSVGSSAAQEAGLSQMLADLLLLSPYNSRPLMQSHWSSPQVPLGMVATRPVYPSSLIIHTDSGYQRARDFRSDSKYTQETFDNIPRPGTPQNPGSGSQGRKI